MTHETKAGIVISASFICLVGYVVAKKSWEPAAPVAPSNVGSDGQTLAPPDPTPLVNVNAGTPEGTIPTLRSPPAGNGELQLTGGHDDSAGVKPTPSRDEKDPFDQIPLRSPTPAPSLPPVVGDAKLGVVPDTKMAVTPPLKSQDADPASAEAMRKAMEELNKKTGPGTDDKVAEALKNQPVATVPSLNLEPQKPASDNAPRPGDVNPYAIKQPATAPAISTSIQAPASSQTPRPDQPAIAGGGGSIGLDSGAKGVTPQDTPPRADAGGLQPLGMSPARAPIASTGPGAANGSSGAETSNAPIGTERPLAPLGTTVGGSGQVAVGQTVPGTNGADFRGSAQSIAPSQPPFEPVSRPAIGLTPAATAQPIQAALPLKRPRAVIESSDAKPYICRQGDTFASISQAQYGSDKFGQALLQYNLDDPGVDPGLRPNIAAPQPGQRILIPQNAYTLQGKYASLILDRPGAMAPVQAAPFQTASSAAVPGNPIAAATSVTGEKTYRVHSQGEMFLTIARNTLGDENRWPEIYRLNPRFDPKDPLPGGSILRLPGDARIDPADMP